MYLGWVEKGSSGVLVAQAHKSRQAEHSQNRAVNVCVYVGIHVCVCCRLTVLLFSRVEAIVVQPFLSSAHHILQLLLVRPYDMFIDYQLYVRMLWILCCVMLYYQHVMLRSFII